MGWLNATPKRDDKQGVGVTRLTALTNKANLGADVPDLDPPDVDDEVSHLLGHFFEVGPSAGGETLTYSELKAWSDLTGTRLSSWSYDALRRMSGAYLNELHEAADPNRPSPAAPPVPTQDARERIAQERERYFDRLAAGEADKKGRRP